MLPAAVREALLTMVTASVGLEAAGVGDDPPFGDGFGGRRCFDRVSGGGCRWSGLQVVWTGG